MAANRLRHVEVIAVHRVAEPDPGALIAHIAGALLPVDYVADHMRPAPEPPPLQPRHGRAEHQGGRERQGGPQHYAHRTQPHSATPAISLPIAVAGFLTDERGRADRGRPGTTRRVTRGLLCTGVFGMPLPPWQRPARWRSRLPRPARALSCGPAGTV